MFLFKVQGDTKAWDGRQYSQSSLYGTGKHCLIDDCEIPQISRTNFDNFFYLFMYLYIIIFFHR